MKIKSSKVDSNKAVWTALTEHVARGDQAVELLREVFLDTGHYGHNRLSEKTMLALREFVGFDDSE